MAVQHNYCWYQLASNAVKLCMKVWTERRFVNAYGTHGKDTTSQLIQLQLVCMVLKLVSHPHTKFIASMAGSQRFSTSGLFVGSGGQCTNE